MAWLFNLEDGGPIIGKDLSAEGTSKDAGQVEDFDARKEALMFSRAG